MATEAAPKPARGSKEPKAPVIRTVEMAKTSPEFDYPRLQNYKRMGYTVTEQPWAYELSCPQSEFDKRQKEYQQKGIDQAERVNKGVDSEGKDTARETTVSTSSRVPMTAEDLLSDDGDPDMVNP